MADANSNPNGYTVESGLAQKGPLLQGSQITINELSSPNFQPTGRSFSMEVTNNAGKFNPNGIYFVSPYLSTTASGYYFNEITGQRSNDTVNLRGLSDLSVGGDAVINVNVLSTFSKNRTINLATGTNLINPSTGAPYTTPPAKLPFANARAQAQAETLKAFYINNSASLLSGKSLNGVAQPGSFTALDLNQNRAADQILAAISAMVMTAGQNGSGVNTLLSQIEADLADDGLLNNSPGYSTSVQSQMCAAAATTDFSIVASNLNKAYGTNYQGTDLNQWVDTSGCADQLSNKYKFISTNVTAGIESKSPPYIVGSDDVGQCFSVGSAGDGTIAKLYVNGSAVTNAQIVKLGDSLQIGITPASGNTNTAYIQRSAAISNGVCGPSAGTKVFKYTAAAALSTYTVGGTVTGLASGQSITLLNNGGNVKVVSGNGPFTFSTALTQGTNFSVTILSQPSGQSCNVSNGYGSVVLNVTNVVINCVVSNASTVTIGGTVTGLLNGQSITVLNNGTNPSSIKHDGTFNLSSTYPQGYHYSIDIQRPTYGQICTIDNAVGNANTNITNVLISCTPLASISNVSTVAGTGSQTYYPLDGEGSSVTFQSLNIITADSQGNYYFTDRNIIRKITSAGLVSTISNRANPGSLDGPVASATFNCPSGLAVDGLGNIYVSDACIHKIRKISPSGFVTTVAGTGYIGNDDGVGSQASFNSPQGIAVDSRGNIYVADSGNQKIRKITSTGIVSTLAGNSSAGALDGVGATAKFCNPMRVALDNTGTVYVAEGCGSLFTTPNVRKITADGVVSTLFQTDGAGALSSGQFRRNQAISVDQSGNIFLIQTDMSGSSVVLKVSPDGASVPFAGSGQQGDVDGAGAAASFLNALDIAVDVHGIIFLTEGVGTCNIVQATSSFACTGNRIRKITPN